MCPKGQWPPGKCLPNMQAWGRQPRHPGFVMNGGSDVERISMAIVSMVIFVLTGCAGGTSNPVFNTSAQKAYIYSPSENTSGPAKGATGEVRYCGAGMPPLVQERKKNALAAAAQACGGENNYAILGESQTDDAPATFMGVAVQCTGFAGRIVYFKCKGAQPQPTGATK